MVESQPGFERHAGWLETTRGGLKVGEKKGIHGTSNTTEQGETTKGDVFKYKNHRHMLGGELLYVLQREKLGPMCGSHKEEGCDG